MIFGLPLGSHLATLGTKIGGNWALFAEGLPGESQGGIWDAFYVDLGGIFDLIFDVFWVEFWHCFLYGICMECV